jgi:hypothetical protein
MGTIEGLAASLGVDIEGAMKGAAGRLSGESARRGESLSAGESETGPKLDTR